MTFYWLQRGVDSFLYLPPMMALSEMDMATSTTRTLMLPCFGAYCVINIISSVVSLGELGSIHWIMRMNGDLNFYATLELATWVVQSGGQALRAASGILLSIGFFSCVLSLRDSIQTYGNTACCGCCPNLIKGCCSFKYVTAACPERACTRSSLFFLCI